MQSWLGESRTYYLLGSWFYLAGLAFRPWLASDSYLLNLAGALAYLAALRLQAKSLSPRGRPFDPATAACLGATLVLVILSFVDAPREFMGMGALVLYTLGAIFSLHDDFQARKRSADSALQTQQEHDL